MNGFAEKYNLSRRELEVVEVVIRGMSNKEAANELFVTEKTIKFHLTNIFKKVVVKSRAQLIVKYNLVKNGLPLLTNQELILPVAI